MKVLHNKLGAGTVVSQDADKVTVDFNGEVKTLITKFARLTTEDGTPFGEQFKATDKKPTKFEKGLAQARREAAMSPEAKAKRDAAHARFNHEMKVAELNDLYLPCQVSRMLNK